MQFRCGLKKRGLMQYLAMYKTEQVVTKCFFFFLSKRMSYKVVGQSFDYAKTLPIAKGFSTQVRLHGLETCTCICINSNSLDYAKRRP